MRQMRRKRLVAIIALVVVLVFVMGMIVSPLMR